MINSFSADQSRSRWLRTNGPKFWIFLLAIF